MLFCLMTVMTKAVQNVHVIWQLATQQKLQLSFRQITNVKEGEMYRLKLLKLGVN